jgi:hypothetical protein
MKTGSGKIKMKNIRSVGAILCVVLFVSGCVMDRILPTTPTPDDTIAVSSGDAKIIIGGAAGYCVNKRQSRTGKSNAFVILGPCEPETAHTKALLVASISADPSFDSEMDVSVLKKFIVSDRGKKMLSNNGNPADVRIGTITQSDGVLYVFTHDEGAPVIPETATDKWRGFFPVAGRMVIISMVNFTENVVPDDEMLAHLKSFAAAIRKLNS